MVKDKRIIEIIKDYKKEQNNIIIEKYDVRKRKNIILNLSLLPKN